MSQWNHAISYRLTQPFRIEGVEQEIKRQRPDEVLVRPRLTSVCSSDLKLYSGSRDRRALNKKLPLALLHEGVVEVVEAGPTATVQAGTRVVVVPNIPCYYAYPDLYPSKEEACLACRPGGAGENYCLHNLYLSSNADGLAQSVFRHPSTLTLPVDSSIPDTVAALTEPLTTILAGCEKAPISKEKRYLILGNGPIGQLVAVALRAFYGIPQDAIWMTGHDWENRRQVLGLIGTAVDATDPKSLSALRSTISIAFECVGGDSNSETLAQAVDCLQPGGTAILYGPSEKAVPINTREVVGKGLSFIGSNRSFVRHFQWVLDQMRDPEARKLMEIVASPTPLQVRSADDLNHALYHAWTKREANKTLIAWPGLE